MGQVKISELPELETVPENAFVPVVSGGQNQKAQVANLPRGATEIIVLVTDLPPRLDEEEEPIANEYQVDASVYGGRDPAQTRLTIVAEAAFFQQVIYLQDDASRVLGAEIEILIDGNAGVAVAHTGGGQTIDGDTSFVGASPLQTGGKGAITLRCVDSDTGAWVRTSSRYTASVGRGEVSPYATHALAPQTITGTSSLLTPTVLRALIVTTNAGAVALQLGTDSSFGWTTGSVRPILNGYHAGGAALTIVPDEGVTVHGNRPIAPGMRWQLHSVAVDEWSLTVYDASREYTNSGGAQYRDGVVPQHDTSTTIAPAASANVDVVLPPSRKCRITVLVSGTASNGTTFHEQRRYFCRTGATARESFESLGVSETVVNDFDSENDLFAAELVEMNVGIMTTHVDNVPVLRLQPSNISEHNIALCVTARVESYVPPAQPEAP
jgi:hypothetical protein